MSRLTCFVLGLLLIIANTTMVYLIPSGVLDGAPWYLVAAGTLTCMYIALSVCAGVCMCLYSLSEKYVP